MGTIKCPKCGEKISDSSRSCKYCGYDGITSYILQIEKNKFSKKLQEEIKEREKRDYEREHTINQPQPQYIPHCPTCGSPDVQKIGGVERAASIGMFGIFSRKINKSMKCRNCGYMW